MRTEKLNFRTGLPDLVMGCWSVTQQMIVYKGRLLKKFENCSLSCVLVSAYAFQTLHFICEWFGCKLWLLLIQNHARHCFQAVAHLHLKSLCCSVWIWADALFFRQVVNLDPSRTCFAQHSIWNMLFCSYVIFLLRDQGMIESIVKQWALLWFATTSHQCHQKFPNHFTYKKT